MADDNKIASYARSLTEYKSDFCYFQTKCFSAKLLSYENKGLRYEYSLVQNCNLKCMICLFNIEKSDKHLEITICNHIFHRQCLDTYDFANLKVCPLCNSGNYRISRSLVTVDTKILNNTQ